MRRVAIALMTALLLVIASIADFYVTLHYNPSLTQEANPIVSLFGGGATGLILVNLIVLCPIFVSLWLYAKRMATKVCCDCKNEWEHAGVLLFEQRLSKSQFLKNFLLFRSRPVNRMNYYVAICFVGAWALIGGRAAAVFTWISIYELDWKMFYAIRSYTRVFGYPTFELMVGAVFFYYALVYYAKTEYEFSGDI